MEYEILFWYCKKKIYYRGACYKRKRGEANKISLRTSYIRGCAQEIDDHDKTITAKLCRSETNQEKASSAWQTTLCTHGPLRT